MTVITIIDFNYFFFQVLNDDCDCYNWLYQLALFYTLAISFEPKRLLLMSKLTLIFYYIQISNETTTNLLKFLYLQEVEAIFYLVEKRIGRLFHVMV